MKIICDNNKKAFVMADMPTIALYAFGAFFLFFLLKWADVACNLDVETLVEGPQDPPLYFAPTEQYYAPTQQIIMDPSVALSTASKVQPLLSPSVSGPPGHSGVQSKTEKVGAKLTMAPFHPQAPRLSAVPKVSPKVKAHPPPPYLSERQREFNLSGRRKQYKDLIDSYNRTKDVKVRASIADYMQRIRALAQSIGKLNSLLQGMPAPVAPPVTGLQGVSALVPVQVAKGVAKAPPKIIKVLPPMQPKVKLPFSSPALTILKKSK